MSFSISVKVDAWGQVTVDAIDQAGGCPFTVATTPMVDTAGLPLHMAQAKVAAAMLWSNVLGPEWNPLRPLIADAVRAIMACLPESGAFDEDGRPVRSERGAQ